MPPKRYRCHVSGRFRSFPLVLLVGPRLCSLCATRGARMSRLPRVAFGVADLASAALVAFAVFVGLPERFWLVDGGAVVISVVFAGAGAGLLLQAAWARRVARVASAVVLAIGLALVATLALT